MTSIWPTGSRQQAGRFQFSLLQTMTMTIKDVAVIGAGPSGLVALRTLLAHGFKNITCFEREPMRGGLWNYYAKPAHSTVPSEDPFVEPPGWTSPMYDELETNVDTETMTFGTDPLDSSFPLYIDRREVLGYVRRFGKQVDQYIRYSHKITDVRKDGSKWVVTSVNGGDSSKKEEFDAVIFATGNFNLPNLPDRQGLKEWVAKYPGSVIHSKSYRSASYYKDKTVVIVGGSVSAYDIARQINPVCRKLHQSIRSKKVSELLALPSINYVGDIQRFDPDSKSLVDVDDNVLENVDEVIFATGYLRSYPALTDINSGKDPVISEGGLRLHNVYQHLFYIPDPTLVFLTTPNSIVPFPTAEIQSIYVALVWLNQLHLPTVDEQKKWELDRVQSHGNGNKFHLLKYPENCDYHQYLYDLIYSVDADQIKVHPRDCDEQTRRIRRHMIPLKAGHEKFKQLMGRKAHSIEDMIEHGCFQWDSES